MFVYDKKLQYPVKIDNPNPKLASIIISQYGGPDGEMGASMRYLSQRYSMPFDELKGLLTDIGTEAAIMLHTALLFYDFFTINLHLNGIDFMRTVIFSGSSMMILSSIFPQKSSSDPSRNSQIACEISCR